MFRSFDLCCLQAALFDYLSALYCLHCFEWRPPTLSSGGENSNVSPVCLSDKEVLNASHLIGGDRAGLIAAWKQGAAICSMMTGLNMVLSTRGALW